MEQPDKSRNPIDFNPLIFQDFESNHVNGSPLKYWATRWNNPLKIRKKK